MRSILGWLIRLLARQYCSLDPLPEDRPMKTLGPVDLGQFSPRR